MKVKITDATKMLRDMYARVCPDRETVDWLTEMALELDLEGNRFSGFDEAIRALDKKQHSFAEFTLEVDKPALKLIDCRQTDALVVMKDLLPLAAGWAKEQGQIFIGFKNGGYHENLGTIARKFAEQNLICVYSSNGGPQGVVPYGGSRDVFGTNPIAYGIPTSRMPIVFDAATAQYAYGTIKQAKESGQSLEARTYLDKDGNYTTDPNSATALIPFGGYKGYAINLLLEVLTGALVGGKSGTLQSSTSELGGFMLLIDPSAFGALEDFHAQTDQLVRDIETNPPAEGFSEVRLPGYRAQKLRQEQLERGWIEVDDMVYARFQKKYDELVQNRA